jgi:hypothetical protein
MNIVAVAVIMLCDDGKRRRVQLSGKQPKQILGFVTHIQGGEVHLLEEPVLLVKEPTGNGSGKSEEKQLQPR